VTEQPRKQWPDEQLSREENEFLQRWRELIDRVGADGGQQRVARRLKWTTSTVSRDYTGKTLPSDERLQEMSDYLRLPQSDRVDLGVRLRRARDARQARRKMSSVSSPHAPAAPLGAVGQDLGQGTAVTMLQETGTVHHRGTGPAHSARSRRPLDLRIAGAFVAVVALVAVVLVWHPWDGQQPTAGSPQAGVQGIFPGEGLQAVQIPVKSLTPLLAKAFRQGRTASARAVTGYEFRNAESDSLCLTVVDTGPTAGQNKDRVEIATCGLMANQIWIPEQWEVNGSAFTHLVSDKYQSMCLNADNLSGLGDGHRTQLWNCYYPANNESWDFGDWYRNVQPGDHSYPICLHTDRLCLDADKFDFGDGDRVNIWTQYATRTQFWS
jgi:hypothetical protein